MYILEHLAVSSFKCCCSRGFGSSTRMGFTPVLWLMGLRLREVNAISLRVPHSEKVKVLVRAQCSSQNHVVCLVHSLVYSEISMHCMPCTAWKPRPSEVSKASGFSPGPKPEGVKGSRKCESPVQKKHNLIVLSMPEPLFHQGEAFISLEELWSSDNKKIQGLRIILVCLWKEPLKAVST